MICEDILGYESGQVFPSLITKKMREYDFYPREVILKTLETCKPSLHYQFSQGGKFDNESGKIFYIFAVVKNHINNVYSQWQREQRQERKSASAPAPSIDEGYDFESLGSKSNHSSKDISNWLSEDDK